MYGGRDSFELIGLMGLSCVVQFFFFLLWCVYRGRCGIFLWNHLVSLYVCGIVFCWFGCLFLGLLLGSGLFSLDGEWDWCLDLFSLVCVCVVG